MTTDTAASMRHDEPPQQTLQAAGGLRNRLRLRKHRVASALPSTLPLTLPKVPPPSTPTEEPGEGLPLPA